MKIFIFIKIFNISHNFIPFLNTICLYKLSFSENILILFILYISIGFPDNLSIFSIE